MIKELQQNNGTLKSYADFLHGQEYLEAVRTGRIQDNDIILMLSLDGAQLYAYKSLDAWIYIWVIFEHAPNVCYKKRHVLPGAVIPGLNKLKKVDLYLFPSLHHLTALQCEGL